MPNPHEEIESSGPEWAISKPMFYHMPDPAPDDLPSESFEVVTPIGTEGGFTIWGAHWLRFAIVEQGVVKDEDVHVREMKCRTKS